MTKRRSDDSKASESTIVRRCDDAMMRSDSYRIGDLSDLRDLSERSERRERKCDDAKEAMSDECGLVLTASGGDQWVRLATDEEKRRKYESTKVR